MLENEKEKDINEVFDDILLSEENIINQSYQEGFELGSSQGNPEGYHLGYHRGAELGAEIGYYTGVIDTYLNRYKQLPDRAEKLVKSLENLKELLGNFPKNNAEDIDILEYANNIRAKYKKICAQLKVNPIYPENPKLSF